MLVQCIDVMPGACYSKYASKNSDGTTRTCNANHVYFYISEQCLTDLRYSDHVPTTDTYKGKYDITATHHRQTSAGSTSQAIVIFIRDDKDKVSDTSGDVILQGRADNSAVVFRPGDYLVLPAYAASFWTAA